MLIGAISIPRTVERSKCRISLDYCLDSAADYKMHSTTLMPDIPFEEAKTTIEKIDESVFVNGEETKLKFNEEIELQNFITTKYVGKIPYEEYGPPTPMGTEFQFMCTGGNPSYNERYFGTTDVIRGNAG